MKKISISKKNIFLTATILVSFVVLLVTASIGFLFTEKQRLLSEKQHLHSELLQAKSTILSMEAREKATKSGYYYTKVDESRIGTDPKGEVIPRMYDLFQQENITMDPFLCRYPLYGYCYTQIQYEGKLYEALNPSELELYLANNQEAGAYYERIASIFTKNQYTVKPETTNELRADGTRYRRTDISHPRDNIVCSIEMTAVETEANGNGRSMLNYPFVHLSCVNIDEINSQYLALQKAIIRDLNMAEDNHLRVNTFTENFALVSDQSDCMLLKKGSTAWTVLESTSCQDPSWNRGGPLETVLNTKYGVPLEDAKILGIYE